MQSMSLPHMKSLVVLLLCNETEMLSGLLGLCIIMTESSIYTWVMLVSYSLEHRNYLDAIVDIFYPT
uniref:Uncharacterized protein n=1 Tax=Aegilops tauschii subsp. strangulata TaxID=200361 RepID=A0A453PPJ9_AEGTS